MTQNFKDSFLHPIGRYHGEFSPSNLAFNSNLQEFAQQASYLCNLEANGKISFEATYMKIKQLWQQLEQSKQELLDNTNFTPDE
jgi:hypothetical protein